MARAGAVGISCPGSRAVWQYIDNLAPLQVHDDGPIITGFAPVPVIDACYPNSLLGAESGDMALQLPQNGVVADRHAKTPHQALSRQAAGAVAKKLNEFSNTPGSTRVRRSNFGQLISKCSALTISVAASPSAYPKPHGHDHPLDR